jgi:hypothetical protein
MHWACVHLSMQMVGGAEGIRTPDPLLAKQVLSQLSYSPTASDSTIVTTLV